MTTITLESEMHSTQKGWRTFALGGGLIALLGLLAILLPFVTGVAVTYMLGVLLVVGGLVHAVHALTTRGWKGSIWQLTLAVISAIAGILLLASPVLGLLSLTLLAIAYLFIDGIAELGLSLRMKGESGRSWIAASGALSLVLAVLLWAAFPADAVWIVGLYVGVSLFMTGLTMVTVAYGGRQIDEGVASSPAP